MNQQRPKITLTWRPVGVPARRHDDFIEIGSASATTRTLTPAPLEVVPARRADDIGRRLENWGRWSSSSDGPGSAACMTGAICESMRKAAGAGVPRAGEPGPTIDADDAVLVARAMVKITFDQRRLLGLLYVDQQRKGFIAAMLRIPPADFDKHLFAAQDAVSAALSLCQNSNNK